jgi:ABC-type dipeptide/oligopeptide/nickel transport system ATPase component
VAAPEEHFDRDITKVGSEDMRPLRGAELAMIFQDPLTSAQPLFGYYGDSSSEACSPKRISVSGGSTDTPRAT